MGRIQHYRSSDPEPDDCMAIWQTYPKRGVIMLEHVCGRKQEHEPPHRCVNCGDEHPAAKT